ncbi:MAG: hypothetical protein GY932_12375 [Arcobacter sp.]|nr:hypothetical protein [Arcobacter sp.]
MSFIKKVILFSSFILACNYSFSQNYINYTISDGLPSNHVYRITQDNLGFIWIITDKGMVKFDGKTFKQFTTHTGMPINDIWNIRITPDNKVWYFSKSRELGYIEKDSIYTFTSNVENEVLSPRIIGQNKNSIFFQSGKASYQLENNYFYKSAFPDRSNSHQTCKIISDSIDSYLVNDIKSDSLFLIDRYNKIIWNDSYSSKKNEIYSIHGQLNDSLYYFLSNQGILFVNYKTLIKKNLKYKDHLNIDWVNISRLHDINNQIQITGEHFVSYLSDDYQLVNVKYLPKELDTHFSFIDKSGNIWSASFSKGVFFHPVEKFNTKTYFINDKVQHIELIDGQVYTSIYKKGLFVYNDNSNSFELKKKNKEFTYEFKKIDSLNFKMYSTENKVFKINKDQFSVIENHYEFKGTNILGRKFELHNGYLYANNHAGVNKFNPNGFKFIEQYKSLAINNLVSFKNRLILGSSSGLKELTNDTIIQIVNFDLLKLPIIVVKKLNDSKLLIGTDGFGVYTFDGIKPILLKQTEGLSVEDIFVENDNKFWIATQKGVYRLIKDDNTFNVDVSFFKSDGLLTDKVNSIVVKDNLLYAGTDIGISSFNINKLYRDQLYKIYIKNILLGNKKLPTDKISVKYKPNNNIQVDFGFIDFQNQDNITTSYRLYPLQEQWTDINSNQINLNNLLPDNYVLEIKIVNHENLETIKKIPIEITPIYWQELWFQILSILLILFILSLTAYYLSRNVQQKKHKKLLLGKELAEIQLKALRSQMNPHFVFNSLAAIQYYINNNDFEASEGYLIKFSKLIRQFFELTKENEILVSDEIKLLTGYLEIEKLRFKNKLNYNIDVDNRINLNSIKIPSMLLQPIVENAVNHGIFNKLENGHVEIKFSYIDDDSFTVEIKDDGVGMINTKKHRKNKIISSTVLKDRLYYLNKSGEWKIVYTNNEVFPELEEKGNISIFTIRKLVKWNK